MAIVGQRKANYTLPPPNDKFCWVCVLCPQPKETFTLLCTLLKHLDHKHNRPLTRVNIRSGQVFAR